MVRRDVGGVHLAGAAFYFFVLLFLYLRTAIINYSSQLLCNWSDIAKKGVCWKVRFSTSQTSGTY